MASNREVRRLLGRAAEGPVGPAPIAELVGVGARRRRTWQAAGVGLTAAVTAAALVTGFAIAEQSNDRTNRQPPPSQTPLVLNGGGPTAAQIASGTWQGIPAPPIKRCGTQTVTSSEGLVVLVISRGTTRCPNAAAAYNARTNRWRKLQTPPAALHGHLIQANNLFVSRPTGAAAVLNLHNGKWHSLPTAPTAGSLAVIVDTTTSAALIGAGRHHDQVFYLAGKHWISGPTMPHPGSDVVALGAYSDGSTQWAFVSEERTTRDGFSGGLTLLRLTDGGWTRRPNLPNRPLAVLSVQSLGTEQFVIGNDCLPNASCPPSGPQLEIADLSDGELRDLDGPYPLSRSQSIDDAVLAGGAVIALDTDTGIGSGGPGRPAIKPTTTNVYDLASRRWMVGPQTVQVANITGTVWTPHGLVILGDPTEKCACSLGGLVLRPS